MDFKKLTGEKPKIDGDQHRLPILKSETLNAADARAATEAYKKARAKIQIEETSRDIINFIQVGSFRIVAGCDHPDFITHFEKRGFNVTKVQSIAECSVIIEW